MSFTVLMMNKLDVERYSLALPANVAENCGKRAVGHDQAGKEFGIWWYNPIWQTVGGDRKWFPLYSGTYDADHPIGDPSSSQVQMFDSEDEHDRLEYQRELANFTDSPLAGGGAGPVLLELKDEGLEQASERDFEVSEHDTGEEIIPFDLGTKRPLDAGDVETPE